jgi:hypothetical protein
MDLYHEVKMILGDLCDRLRFDDPTLRTLDLSVLPETVLVEMMKCCWNVSPESQPAWYTKLPLCARRYHD